MKQKQDWKEKDLGSSLKIIIQNNLQMNFLHIPALKDEGNERYVEPGRSRENGVWNFPLESGG